MAWAIIQPFFTMVIFAIFFGCLRKIPSDGIPYPVFAYCQLLPSCPSHPLLGLLEFRLYTPPELLLSQKKAKFLTTGHNGIHLSRRPVSLFQGAYPL